jgi:hypothetical protein
MTFKLDETRIREIAQIEAAANCQIGAGGKIAAPLSPMSDVNLQLPQALYQHLEQLSQKDAGFSIDQFVAIAIAEKIAASNTAS